MTKTEDILLLSRGRVWGENGECRELQGEEERMNRVTQKKMLEGSCVERKMCFVWSMF